MKRVLWGISIISCIMMAQSNKSQVMFVKKSFVHLNDSLSYNSSYSQTLICGTPIDVIKEVGSHYYVKFDKNLGYIESNALVLKAPECFQEKYPQFFQSLNIDSADLFYWGRL